MSAREKFKLGERVVWTGDPLEKSGTGTGIVVGFGRKPNIVRVRQDHLVNAASYSMDFWCSASGATSADIADYTSLMSHGAERAGMGDEGKEG